MRAVDEERAMTRVIGYPSHEVFVTDIVRAENCSLYDSEGIRHVDLESGVWCTPIGHAHPRVLDTLSDQAARISHAGFNYSSGIVEGAAEEVLSLLGFEGGKCTFLCSGSEAVEYGVRVARLVAERPVFMTMADSYFGAYGAASDRQAGDWFSFNWAACAECPDSVRCDKKCELWASIPLDRIGAFLFEPGSSSGFVRFPPRKLIESIVRAVEDNDGLVVVNEVTTGIGRTGTWFGYQHYSITPDIVALGKGIGNGYPVSVSAFSSRVIRLLGDRQVLYAQSHQNDPLGAAVAREVIRTIRAERLIERSRRIADALLSGLEEITARTGRIDEVRARGLMLAVDLKDDPAATLTIHAQRELVRRGFIVARRPRSSTLRLDPALTIDSEDIDGFLAALGDILTEAVDEEIEASTGSTA
jgi:acetylornithine aminotransferase